MRALFFLLSAIIVGLDQWLKFWIVSNFELGDVQTLIDHVFSLTYIRNTGAAWSILEGKMTFFTIITVAAVIVVTYLLIRHRKSSIWFRLGLSFILAGAIGNFIDRLRLGYVVDMFFFFFFFFFFFLVIGVLLIFIYALVDDEVKGK